MLASGVGTYKWLEYRDGKILQHVINYKANPKQNSILIVKYNREALPFSLVYVAEIYENEVLIFKWNTNFNTFSEAKTGINNVITSIVYDTFRDNFSEPHYTSDLRGTYFVLELNKQIDWKKHYSDYDF